MMSSIKRLGMLSGAVLFGTLLTVLAVSGVFAPTPDVSVGRAVPPSEPIATEANATEAPAAVVPNLARLRASKVRSSTPAAAVSALGALLVLAATFGSPGRRRSNPIRLRAVLRTRMRAPPPFLPA